MFLIEKKKRRDALGMGGGGSIPPDHGNTISLKFKNGLTI